MTWYADEIILRATPRALALVSTSQTLRPFSYHVRSLAGHHWYRKEHEHSLPEEGLLVIRPVGPQLFETNNAAPLRAEVTNELLTLLDGETTPPPTSLRQALAAMAATLDQAVIYYSCRMWAGDIDYEYCLSYGPDEALLVTQPDTEDSLRAGLRKVGLDLPTHYFALHTREFPWDTHKLTG